MFRRFFCIGQHPTRLNLFGEAIRRHLHKDDGDNIVLVPGGGLEKLQGGIKEEKYFNDHDLELLAKMRSEGSRKLKCENCVGNWTEFEKVLNASAEPTALRETCSLNKYRNCMEEAYFMNEIAKIVTFHSGSFGDQLDIMTSGLGNPLKIALRKRMKNEVIKAITLESQVRQSKAITEKVLQSESFRNAKHVSIYLSTTSEVDTKDLLHELFRLGKQVFVPTYSGNQMEMVKLKDLQDFDTLPLTKWNIKQPSAKEGRENALTNSHGIDLFLMPGVAFTRSGGRMGHGMGYYDKYLKRHFDTYPQKKVTLMALAFQEQIVDEAVLPLDATDIRLNYVITE